MLNHSMVATFTDRPDLIQVTYKLLSDKLLDPEKKARAIALGQTTNTSTTGASSGQKKLSRHQGEVLGIDERTHIPGRPYEYYLTVGFPPDNTEGDIPKPSVYDLRENQFRWKDSPGNGPVARVLS